jgi:N-acetylmuramoyl-L-alanine amidase
MIGTMTGATTFNPDSSIVERVEPSPNFDDRPGLGRPDMIVLHYTGMMFCHEAIQRLCDPSSRVSSHYVVQENGSVVQLVQEAKRAWHAGVSSWTGESDINARSIGIEICNPGHEFSYPDFPSRQIAAVITLCRSILTRNIIRPENIVAHSDVAPSRKQDPGEKFPWKRLAQSGVGLWVEAGPVSDDTLRPNDSSSKVTELQRMLADYGYGVEVTGRYDVGTSEVVTAFQRHFRPAQVDGLADAITVQTLRKLLIARVAQPKRKPAMVQMPAESETSQAVAAAAPHSAPAVNTPLAAGPATPEPAPADAPFAAGIRPADAAPEPSAIIPPSAPQPDTKPVNPKIGFLRGLWPSSS